MNEQQTCSYCGAASKPGARFCHKCATPFQAQPSASATETTPLPTAPLRASMRPPPSPAPGMLDQISIAWSRSWAWLNGGSYWRLSVPIVAMVLFVTVIAAATSGPKEVTTTETPARTSTAAAGPDVAPLAQAPAAEPVASAPVAPPPSVVAAPANRRNCDLIRGTAYQSEDERTWFLVNCQGPPTPVRLDSISYLSLVADTTTSYSLEMESFTGLLDRGSRNPSLVYDATWTKQLNQSITKMRSYGARIRALTPPVCTQSGHALLTKAVDELDVAFDFVTRGMQRIDAASVEQAVPHMTLGTAYLTQAAASFRSARC